MITSLKNFKKQAVIGVLAAVCAVSPFVVSAQQTLTSGRSTLDPTQSSFSLVVCDGPAGAPGVQTPCDFDHIIIQIQHLMDVMMVLGVLVAIVMFSYAGYLYVSVSFTGKTSNAEDSKRIFWHVLVGFVIMIVAWFAVYQILSWLANSSGATTLLGNP